MGGATNILESAVASTRLCFTLARAELVDRDALEALIERRFAKFTAEQVIQRLDASAIANAHMNTVEGFLEHPQLHARDRIHEVGSPNGPLMSFLPAITIPGMTPVMGDIPAVGEHTEAILAEFGLREKIRT